MAEPTLDAGPLVTGPWLVRLRWAAVLAQVIGVAVAVQALGLALPLPPIAALIIILAISNVLLGRWLSHGHAPRPRVFGAFLALDIALLTALLWLTGGTSNPFTAVYLVYIALTAVTLGSRWTWTMVALSVVGYATLFAIAPPVDPHAAHWPGPELSGHLAGMWVAFLSAAVLIGFFVTRVREALDQREGALAEARRVAASRDRLASLTTLAAGAAHELATPLATIAVASKELVREAEAAGRGDLIEDAQLIRSQVERCRQILDHMSGRADASVADPPAVIDPAVVVRDALEALPGKASSRVRVNLQGQPTSVRIPKVGVARVLTTLIKNALDASDDGGQVEVSVTTSPDTLAFAVRDRGRGMDEATLARAGEPFFTTKAAGAGFGLGLFLVKTFVEQWGGRFTLTSKPTGGTEAAVSFTAHGHAA
jgi:two-component system sensor histidine kinase RegB